MSLPECDYCDSTESLKQLDDNLVCPNCEAKGIHRANQNAKLVGQGHDLSVNKPININDVLRQSRDIDSSIKVRTDIFNAATVAIIDLKKSIDEDTTIENKPFTLATELVNRLNHFKSLIFGLNEQILEAQNNQQAIQRYMNQLANQLRADEREKLKIQDIHYNPGPPKKVTVKSIRLAKPKLDKVELRKYATELGIPEFTLQMVVVSKGITVQAAAELISKSKVTNSTT